VKAKISAQFLKALNDRPEGDLVLVTAMNPTPAGEGKTTTNVDISQEYKQVA
jgi:formate--tetrahydrofolate ligase